MDNPANIKVIDLKLSAYERAARTDRGFKAFQGRGISLQELEEAADQFRMVGPIRPQFVSRTDKIWPVDKVIAVCKGVSGRVSCRPLASTVGATAREQHKWLTTPVGTMRCYQDICDILLMS